MQVSLWINQSVASDHNHKDLFENARCKATRNKNADGTVPLYRDANHNDKTNSSTGGSQLVSSLVLAEICIFPMKATQFSPQYVSHTDGWPTFARKHMTGLTVIAVLQVRVPSILLFNLPCTSGHISLFLIRILFESLGEFSSSIHMWNILLRRKLNDPGINVPYLKVSVTWPTKILQQNTLWYLNRLIIHSCSQQFEWDSTEQNSFICKVVI